MSLLIAKPRAGNAAHGEAEFWQHRGAEYARKFFASVARHVTLPHRTWLLTDSPELLPVGVAPLACSHVVAPGWWRKLDLLEAFRVPDGPVFYSDLDNVICGNIDAMLRIPPHPIVMMDDMVHAGLANAGAMLFDPARLYPLWQEWQQHPKEIMQEFSQWPEASDQAFIASRVRRLTRAPIEFFQDYLTEGSIQHLAQPISGTPCFLLGGWKAKPHTSVDPRVIASWRE